MMHRSLISLLAAIGVSACYGYVEPAGAVEITGAYVEPPAVEVEASPYVYYGGRPTYFYGGRWYYRDHGHWRYYRSEPRYLRENRGRFERERRGPERRGHPH